MASTERTILALHPGALGDVVLFGHLLAELPGRVTLVAGGEKARLLAGLGVVETAADFDVLPVQEAFSDVPLAECQLPGLLGPHERLISCFAGGDARVERRLAALCGASEAAFLPTRPPTGFDGHLTDLWAGRLGLPAWPAAAAWRVPDAWTAAAERALVEGGIDPAGRYAVIHPGAGSEAKCWPLERFGEVGAGLAARGVQVAYVLGPVERDRWRNGRLEALGQLGPVLGPLPLSALAGVLGGAAAYVGNDSGASHLAAAVGAHTVAVFGPTSAVHFRPLGPHVTVFARGRLADVTSADVLAGITS